MTFSNFNLPLWYLFKYNSWNWKGWLMATRIYTRAGWKVLSPLKYKMNGKIYFNGIKKEICLHQLFSELRNYFSTKSPRTSIHFRQRCPSFFFKSVTGLPLRVLSLKSACPNSPSLNRLTQRLTVPTSTH